MGTTSGTSVEPAVPGSAAATTGAAPSPGLQDAAQNVLPTPNYLDPEWIKEGVPDTQFYKDYPPDSWGQEAAPNARVWKIYRDEMTRMDTETLESWNGTLDVLLIFAGLFSAVSTAFIVESYKSLQPDYTQYIASFLHTVVSPATSNLTVNGGIILHIAGSMGPPDSFVHPSATQRWTNGLWFTSLVISLTVALLCILIKQWLDQYRARTKRSVSTLQGWARRHQLYYRGLSSWGVPTLISLLPLFLHVSLFLFFAGLVLFLRPLDAAIAFTLLAIIILTLLFYLLSMVIPAFCIDCPSYTPLLAQARCLITCGVGLLAYLSNVLKHRVSQDGDLPAPRGPTRITCIKRAVSDAHDVLEKLLIRCKQRFARETSAIDEQQYTLDGWALTTLLVSTNDPDVIDAGVEAVGSITAEPTLEAVVRDVPQEVINDRIKRDLLTTGATSSAFAVLTDTRRVRTDWALEMRRGLAPFRQTADLYPCLGLEGMMIQVMAAGPFYHAPLAPFRRQLHAHVLNLRHQAKSDQIGQFTSGLNRATCLLFLRNTSNSWVVYLGHYDVPYILLTFCAGDFAQAQPHEQELAIQTTLAALERVSRLWSRVKTPTGRAPTRTALAVALDILDPLFAFLATHEELLANQDAALPFMHHLGLVSQSMCRPAGILRQLRWEKFAGFAAFTQMASFEQNVSRVRLEGYIAVLACSVPPSDEDAELSQQHWTCVARLISRGHGPLEDITQLLVRIRDFSADPKRMITVFGHASDTILLMFLRDTTSLFLAPRSCAEALSCLLCYRLRHQPLGDELVQPLFTGRFLVNRFLRLIADTSLEPEQRRLLIMQFAKHCARLSDPNRLSSGCKAATETSARPLDAMLSVCDELENQLWRSQTQGPGLAVRTNIRLGMVVVIDIRRGLAVVTDIRRGLEPGGELRGECEPTCDCWYQPEVQPTTRTTRWRNRILGRISASSDSESAV